MSQRTVALLGAGASMEAGLPSSAELTERLGRWLADRPRGTCSAPVYLGEAKTYQHVVGKIITSQIDSGGDPFAQVDVERLFSALDLLSRKDSLEISPFVGNWLDEPQAQMDIDFYSLLLRSIKCGLVQILSGVESVKFEYLKPLVASSESPRVATLNYDTGIEFACQLSDVACDTGFESWRGGFDWNWNGGDGVKLLKLHGCIKHRMSEGLGGFGRVAGFALAPLESDYIEMGHLPAIVFGSQGKLRVDGPFLAMLIEFGKWLDAADHLVICGYSLRDGHVNHLIHRWLSVLPHRRVSIIDPSFPTSPCRVATNGQVDSAMPRLIAPGSPLRESILEYMYDPESEFFFPASWKSSSPRFEVYRVGAGEGLSRVFKAGEAEV